MDHTDGDPVIAAQLKAMAVELSGPLMVVVGRWSGTRSAIPVLVIGPDDPSHMIECIESGARGYVVDVEPIEAMLGAARAVLDGRAVVPDHLLGSLLRHVVDRRRQSRVSQSALEVLSVREREVFDIAARGADKHTIGDSLLISPETARTHLSNIFAKLGVGSRSELIAFAASMGLDVSPINSRATQ